MIGFLKTWNHDRGFGFIARRDDGGDVFIHASELVRAGFSDVRIGDELRFEVGAGREGKSAALGVTLAGQGSGASYPIRGRGRWAA